MSIMDMTLRQIINEIPHHIVCLLTILSVLLNFEAIVRQVAVEKGYTKAVNICDRFAKLLVFVIDIVNVASKKNNPPTTPLANQKVD